jgi:hypothetical protein
VTMYQTDPMPRPWPERTPMAKAIEWATEQVVTSPILLGTLSTLPPETTKELVDARVADHLDGYARNLEESAAIAAVDDAGIIAIWHGSTYEIFVDPGVPAGHLVERRCDCRQREAAAERARTASLN